MNLFYALFVPISVIIYTVLLVKIVYFGSNYYRCKDLTWYKLTMLEHIVELWLGKSLGTKKPANCWLLNYIFVEYRKISLLIQQGKVRRKFVLPKYQHALRLIQVDDLRQYISR